MRVWIRGLGVAALRRLGVTPSDRVGPIHIAQAGPEAIRRLAEAGAELDAPPSLRPALNQARVEVGADKADFGDGFRRRHRGEGVLIGAYDSGVDLEHPDFMTLEGRPRVVAVWDQDDPTGPSPDDRTGRLCNEFAIREGQCPARDPSGHGTFTLAVAASSGPKYRGIAPAAQLVVARSDTYGQPLGALSWMAEIAGTRPMVVVLPLVTQEGPHDGSSALAAAIDAYPHLVVAAAGNDGLAPVHAQLRPRSGQPQRLALRFEPNPGPRSVIVDIWGARGAPLSAKVVRVRTDGSISAGTDEVSLGDAGRTEVLTSETSTLASVDLDPALPDPETRAHVRLELRLSPADSVPLEPGFWVVEVAGEGRIDAWLEPGPGESTVPTFYDEAVLPVDNQVLGDTNHTLSDPATARAALAVSAYVSRTDFPVLNRTFAGTVGRLADYSGRGPTLAEAQTGPKPELAAPGAWIVAAWPLRGGPTSGVPISPLYRLGGGTSVSAPLVAGAAALLAGAAPTESKGSLKQHLLASAAAPGDGDDPDDPRWGYGKLDVDEALKRVAETDGCGCRSAEHSRPEWAWTLLLLLAIAARRRLA